MTDPVAHLYATVADRPGWAWQQQSAVHLASTVRVVVDADRPRTPFRVQMVAQDDPYWLAEPASAVQMVERHGTPRYTIAEARRFFTAEECRVQGHHLRVQYTADGTPDSVTCRRCPDWWAVAQDHVVYLADTLAGAMAFAWESLPPEEGTPWYDALRRYAPERAEALAEESRRRAARIAEMHAPVPPSGGQAARPVDAPTVPRLELVRVGPGAAGASAAG